MATAHTANIVGDTTFTTPTDRELVATRVFDASPETLWKAHTDKRHVPQWMLGPEGTTMPVCEIDLRPGGRWHFRWRNPDGSLMDMDGEYREIRAPDLFVNTERWGGSFPETVNRTTFTEENGKTRLTCTMVYPSREAREKARDTGMEEGWSASYDRLDEYLQKIK
jgi:uncharacterized protein YndB with AHSA1/START domain